jgi:hypothetical protein
MDGFVWMLVANKKNIPSATFRKREKVLKKADKKTILNE